MRVVGTEVYMCNAYDEAKAALQFCESKGYYGYVVRDPMASGFDALTGKPVPLPDPIYRVFVFEMVEELKLQ